MGAEAVQAQEEDFQDAEACHYAAVGYDVVEVETGFAEMEAERMEVGSLHYTAAVVHFEIEVVHPGNVVEGRCGTEAGHSGIGVVHSENEAVHSGIEGVHFGTGAGILDHREAGIAGVVRKPGYWEIEAYLEDRSLVVAVEYRVVVVAVADAAAAAENEMAAARMAEGSKNRWNYLEDLQTVIAAVDSSGNWHRPEIMSA